MNTHLTLFRIPVQVQAWFWLMTAYFGFVRYGGTHWANFGLWFPIVFFAVLLHELGHALVGRRFGWSPVITLHGLGGVTQSNAAKTTPGRMAIISFAGPFVGLVIGGITWIVQWYAPIPHNQVLNLALSDIVFTNFGWAVFNLIPIVGLDGGHIMGSLLEKFFGVGGVRAAHVISIFVAVAIAMLSLVLTQRTGQRPQLWILFLFGWLAMQNYRAWQMQSRWSEKLRPQAAPRAAAAAPAPQQPEVAIDTAIERGFRALEDRNAAMVRMIAENLAPRVRTDEHRISVAHLLAWGRLLSGDASGARRALDMLPSGQLPDALLDGAILLESGRARDAVAPLTEAVVGRNDDFVSMRLARAVVGSGEVGPVVALVGRETDAKETTARPFQIVVGELSAANRHEEARAVGEALFERFHKGADAFNVACALGRLGRAEEALAWLEKSLEAGLPDTSVIDTDHDLDALRSLPGFDAIRAKASQRG